MIKSFRFSIAGMMGAVVVAAIGAAALCNANPTTAGMMFVISCSVICLAVVGLVCRGSSERAWWLGFGLFGCGYLVLAFGEGVALPLLPTTSVLEAFYSHSVAPSRNAQLDGPHALDPDDAESLRSFVQVGHCLWALIAAAMGALMASAIFASVVSPSKANRAEASPAAASRWFWLAPALIGMAGFAMLVGAIVAGARMDADLGAGMIFLLTWGLISVASLGVLLSRRKTREIWLGSVLLGGGFMIMVFGRAPDHDEFPTFPTARFLNALHPWLSLGVLGGPAHTFNVWAANARIRKALDQPVTMQFNNERLEEVLKYIQATTRGHDGRLIPIYVETDDSLIGGTNLDRTVRIDLEGIPLKTGLRLCLEQLRLDYDIRDGLLLIASEQRLSPVPPDPSYLTAGHCVLALIAAVIGGVLAPLVSDLRRRPES